MFQLMLLYLRAGWRGLLGWAILWSVLVIGTSAATLGLYGTAESRAIYATTMGLSRVAEAFNGRAYDLTTAGGIAAFEIGFIGQLAIPIGICLSVVACTRSEEDSGRADIVTAGHFSRSIPLVAATIVAKLSLLVFGVVCFLGLWLMGLPVAGSAWYATSQVIYGLFFLSFGLLIAQVMPNARMSIGVCLGVILGLFLVRALVDGRHLDMVWLSPMGWMTEFRPWAAAWNYWPLAAFAVSILLFGVAAALIHHVRDIGGGLLAARPGRVDMRCWLPGSLAWVWRIQRGCLIVWVMISALWGAAFGAMGQEIRDIVTANPALSASLGGDHPEDALTGLSIVILVLFALTAGLQVMQRLAAEELSGRLGLVLSAPVSAGWVWSVWVGCALFFATTVVMGGGTSLAVALGAVTGQDCLERILVACLCYLIVVSAVISVVGLIFAVAPRLLWIGWGCLVQMASVALLGSVWKMPQWYRMMSPLEQVGQLPREDAKPLQVTILALICVLAMGIGRKLFPQRDLSAG